MTKHAVQNFMSQFSIGNEVVSLLQLLDKEECAQVTDTWQHTQYGWGCITYARILCISTASFAAAVASLRGTASSPGCLIAGRAAACFLGRVSAKLGKRSVRVLAFRLMLLERRCRLTFRPSRPEGHSFILSFTDNGC